MIEAMHREDVVATIRKRFGSVAAFERRCGLPKKSVSEVLRGRASARVRAAIEQVIDEQDIGEPLPEASGHSATGTIAHRLNDGAR